MTTFEQKYYEADSFWAGSAVADPLNLQRLVSTAHLIPSGVAELLDVGCGNGVFAKTCAAVRPELEVTGMDRSSTALQYVAGKTIEGSIDSIPLPDRSYECVSCLQVIEHLPVDVFEKALAELTRVSKKHLIVSVPINEAIENNTTQCPRCRAVFNVDLHLRSFTIDDVCSMLDGYGFKHVKHVFPCRSQQLYGKNLLRAARRSLTRSAPPFRSPICPLCGYSEGDKTALSLSEAELDQGSVTAGRIKQVRGSLRRVIKSLWPKYEGTGYWVIALYTRSE